MDIYKTEDGIRERRWLIYRKDGANKTRVECIMYAVRNQQTFSSMSCCTNVYFFRADAIFSLWFHPPRKAAATLKMTTPTPAESVTLKSIRMAIEHEIEQ